MDGPTEAQLEDAYEDYTIARPPGYNNNRCPNCDMPFVPDQWDERNVNTPGTAAETWKYACPSCGDETIEVGT